MEHEGARWYDKSWTCRKAFSISSQLTGGVEDVEDFLLPVKTTDPDLAEHAQESGDDLLFTLADGTTKLPHEIRYWDRKAGRLEGLLRVPVISASKDTGLFLYFGNPTCPNQQDRERLWSGYEYRQLFRGHIPGDPAGRVGALQNAAGTPACMVFLRAQKRILEDLFGREWFHSPSDRRRRHPAFSRWKLCERLLDQEGIFHFPEQSDSLVDLARLVIENASLVQCTGGDLESFGLGALSNYGDPAVQSRVRSEVRFPGKYLDVQTELQWAGWHLCKKHAVEAFETAGPDHRIEIEDWELPVLSDCKRIHAQTSEARVRRVIEKANSQVKTLAIPCYGVAVIDLSDKVPIYTIDTLSDDLPSELVSYREAAERTLQTYYRSIGVAVLLWNEIAMLGDTDDAGQILVTLRTRSELVFHERASYPLHPMQAVENLQCQRLIEFRLTVQPCDRQRQAWGHAVRRRHPQVSPGLETEQRSDH